MAVWADVPHALGMAAQYRQDLNNARKKSKDEWKLAMHSIVFQTLCTA
jgi:hypothetical protein